MKKYLKIPYWVTVFVLVLVIAACVAAFLNRPKEEYTLTDNQTYAGVVSTDAIFASYQYKLQADVTHDGTDETIIIMQDFPPPDGEAPGSGAVEIFTQDAAGDTVKIFDWYISHAGSSYLYLTEIDGKQYLLQYFPTEYQGICTYHYEIFSLTESGEKVMYKEVEAEAWDAGMLNDTEKVELQQKAEAFEQKMRNELHNSTTLIEYGPKLPGICTLE